MKPWQKGYELEELKRIASTFKTHYKPYIHGAFGLPKEVAVADALAKGRLATDELPDGGPPAAVAIFSWLKSSSTHEDFTGRKIRLEAGSLFVSHLAGEVGAAIALLNRLAGDHPKVWLELFEEDKALKQNVLVKGFSHIATKVMASSDIRGLYFRGERDWKFEELPPEELLSIACLVPNFLSPEDATLLRYELESYEMSQPWEQHYSSYNKRQSWTAFALKGYDADDPGFIIKPKEMSRKWKAENPLRLPAAPALTTAASAFPFALGIADRIPGEKERVRFMRLEKGGGQLTRHADNTGGDEGLRDGLVCRLHIPIRTSPLVTFYSWDHRGHKHSLNFAERGLYYLDQRKPHAVTNDDPELERVHFVVDVKSSEALRELFHHASSPLD